MLSQDRLSLLFFLFQRPRAAARVATFLSAAASAQPSLRHARQFRSSSNQLFVVLEQVRCFFGLRGAARTRFACDSSFQRFSPQSSMRSWLSRFLFARQQRRLQRIEFLGGFSKNLASLFKLSDSFFPCVMLPISLRFKFRTLLSKLG